MVFQEESFASRWWPLSGRSPCGASKRQCHADGALERDALSLADSLEKGLAHEFTDEFLQPLEDSNTLRKFTVKRSDDRLQYRLRRDGGEFLMYAEVKVESKEVQFFLYDPEDRENNLFDRDRPAFVMTFNASRTEWLLSHLREGVWYSPRRQGVTRQREDVALMQHSRQKVGDGVNHSLDAHIAVRQQQQVAFSPDGEQEDLCTERLCTRQAVWNEELQTLVLDFKGRKVIPSAKNFQLTLEKRSPRVVCQYGKISKNVFALDFRSPLSISQAFAMAVTTLFWE